MVCSKLTLLSAGLYCDLESGAESLSQGQRVREQLLAGLVQQGLQVPSTVLLSHAVMQGVSSMALLSSSCTMHVAAIRWAVYWQI